ncbi:MAG: hypothetical protein M5U08_25320 [Burkholderiales bacterium]|nr:hypothetical protein [Burkholderiales bacterium]
MSRGMGERSFLDRPFLAPRHRAFGQTLDARAGRPPAAAATRAAEARMRVVARAPLQSTRRDV